VSLRVKKCLIISLNNPNSKFTIQNWRMKQLSYLFILVLFFAACQGDSKQTTTTPPTVAIKKIPIPKFDRDAAYDYVAKQVEFGPRVPNSDAHKATKEWLSSELKANGATVIEQDFVATAYTGEKLNSTNIIGQYNPKAKKRIVLAAHWDSRHITDNDPDAAKQNLPVDAADGRLWRPQTWKQLFMGFRFAILV